MPLNTDTSPIGMRLVPSDILYIRAIKQLFLYYHRLQALRSSAAPVPFSVVFQDCEKKLLCNAHKRLRGEKTIKENHLQDATIGDDPPSNPKPGTQNSHQQPPNGRYHSSPFRDPNSSHSEPSQSSMHPVPCRCPPP